MSEISPKSRYQEEMFSSLDAQVDKASIVRVIDKVVDKIYVTKNQAVEKQSEAGRPEYPKRSLLKLYIYGYMNRVKSSRRLERECKVNIEVMWLMGKLKPDHWTISYFRKENQEEIKQAIKTFNKFLFDSGYIEGKTIVIDGTKLKANASSSGNMDMEQIKERVKQTEEKITYYLEVFNQADSEEDEIEELRKEKEELLRQIEELKRGNKKVYVKTDPDSNVMKTKQGKQAAYNVQISCDGKHKLIVATDVNSRANDFEELESMYQKSKEMQGGRGPEEIIADAGYYSPEKIEHIEKDEKLKTYVAPLPERGKGKFLYDRGNDQYICQMGKILKFEKQKKDIRGRKKRYYRCYQCEGCTAREQCTSSTKGRIKIRYINQDFRDKYRAKMQSRESKEKLKFRKAIVEHPIGTIKLWLGKNPLLTRGVQKVNTEISLVTLSYNLLRLFNIEKFERLNEKIDNYQWQMV